MIEKIGKFVAKNVAFAALDIVVPGAGTLAKSINRGVSAANFLGPKATPDRVEDLLEMEDGIMEGVHDFVEDIFGSFL